MNKRYKTIDPNFKDKAITAYYNSTSSLRKRAYPESRTYSVTTKTLKNLIKLYPDHVNSVIANKLHIPYHHVAKIITELKKSGILLPRPQLNFNQSLKLAIEELKTNK